MMAVTIYHNPGCSKSRKTLELLRQHGVETTIVEYLKTPPDATTIKTLLKKLQMTPQALIRSKEHNALGLPDTDDAAELVARLIAYPAIMQRPIVVAGGIAVLGRPPENVLDII